MEDVKFLLVHGGFGMVVNTCIGKTYWYIRFCEQYHFEEFIDIVHSIVHADQRTCDYWLHCLMPSEECGLVQSLIRIEHDLQCLGKKFTTPKIFVTVQFKHDGLSLYGGQSFRQSGIQT